MFNVGLNYKSEPDGTTVKLPVIYEHLIGKDRTKKEVFVDFAKTKNLLIRNLSGSGKFGFGLDLYNRLSVSVQVYGYIDLGSPLKDDPFINSQCYSENEPDELAKKKAVYLEFSEQFRELLRQTGDTGHLYIYDSGAVFAEVPEIKNDIVDYLNDKKCLVVIESIAAEPDSFGNLVEVMEIQDYFIKTEVVFQGRGVLNTV